MNGCRRHDSRKLNCRRDELFTLNNGTFYGEHSPKAAYTTCRRIQFSLEIRTKATNFRKGFDALSTDLMCVCVFFLFGYCRTQQKVICRNRFLNYAHAVTDGKSHLWLLLLLLIGRDSGETQNKRLNDCAFV